MQGHRAIQAVHRTIQVREDLTARLVFEAAVVKIARTLRVVCGNEKCLCLKHVCV